MKINSTFTKQRTKKDGHIETVPYYYEVSYQWEREREREKREGILHHDKWNEGN